MDGIQEREKPYVLVKTRDANEEEAALKLSVLAQEFLIQDEEKALESVFWRPLPCLQV